MTSAGGANRGGTATTKAKTAGNLPLTTNSGGIDASSGSALVWAYYGLASETSTSSVDPTTDTKLLLTSIQWQAPNRLQVDTLANQGCIARYASGTGASPADYRQFDIGGNDTPFGSSTGFNTICIDLNSTGHDSSGGTLSASAITAFAFGVNPAVMNGGSSSFSFFQRVFIFDTDKGATNLPVFTGTDNDWGTAYTKVNGTNYTNKIGVWLQQLGSAYFVPIPFSFGDGSAAAFSFDDGGVTVISPADNAAGGENYRLTTQAMRVYADLDNNANNTLTLSGAYTWGTAAVWDFDQNDAAVITIDGANFSGMGDFTLGSSVTGAATFSLASGSDVIINGADLDGSTINGDLLLNSDTDLTDITVTGALVIDVGASNITLNFSNVNVTGDTTNTGTGTCTINASNGSSLTTTEPGTAAGEVNIVNTVPITITVLDSAAAPITGARLSLEADTGGALAALLATSITRSGSTATATATAHGLATGDTAIIRGATEEEYNEIATVTVTGVNTFTYAVTGTPATPATGSPTTTAQILTGTTNGSGVVTTAAFGYGADQPVTGRVRKGTSSPLYKTAPVAGTITSAGFTTTVTMIDDE